ncbi:unnamed protein product [Closterium sp. NIES-65]|nr:unnamed protein product [Closterium sp. NIES-65]
MSASGTPPRRIVVAIDDSTGSTEALQWALDNMQLQPGSCQGGGCQANGCWANVGQGNAGQGNGGQGNVGFKRVGVRCCHSVLSTILKTRSQFSSSAAAARPPPCAGRDTIVLVNTQSYSAAPTSRPGFHVSQGEIQADTQRKKDVGYKLLEKYKAQCEARQLLCETRVMIGDARLSISEAAEQAKADAVVVGSRGHGALKRLVLGSVSEYCAHHCPMPVVIVRPNKIGQPDPAVPMD